MREGTEAQRHKGTEAQSVANALVDVLKVVCVLRNAKTNLPFATGGRKLHGILLKDFKKYASDLSEQMRKHGMEKAQLHGTAENILKKMRLISFQDSGLEYMIAVRND